MTPDKQETHTPILEAAMGMIPSNVYYSLEHDNFYAMDSRKGMGLDFWNVWQDRHKEFPPSPRQEDE